MTYNYHGSWNEFTGHHSAVFPRSDEVAAEREWNQVCMVCKLRVYDFQLSSFSVEFEDSLSEWIEFVSSLTDLIYTQWTISDYNLTDFYTFYVISIMKKFYMRL